MHRIVRALGGWTAALLVACSESQDAPPAVSSCELLFGNPNAHTGVDSTRCQPRCSCGGFEFAPPTYGAAFVESLRLDWVLEAPFPLIENDPYAGPAPTPKGDDAVCALRAGAAPKAGPRPYTLIDFTSESEARVAGAVVTHFGGCGVCSSLVNLAVYMREPDLTAPVRACGLESKDRAAHVSCLRALGFDEACAQLWYWNTLHTRAKCLGPCLSALSEPYQDETGNLNACLACDEKESGPVFKAIGGRTRRNSGLPNALCRPCSEVRPLVHAYPVN